MNYEKIDAALSKTISRYEELAIRNAPIAVSVRIVAGLSDQQQEELSGLGVENLNSNNGVFPGSVSLENLKKLSEKEYVLLVSLALPEKPLPCLFTPPVVLR